MTGRLSDLLTAIPSPPRSEISLGPFPLRGYAMAIIAGVFVAAFIAERRWIARGGTRGVVGDIAIVSVPVGIVFARIYHVVTSWEQYADSPIDALKIYEGGLGIPGGLLGGVVGGIYVCRRRGVRVSAMLDTVAPGVAVAQAIGRLGNWFNQELYGRPTDLPWALEIDVDHRPARFIGEPTYHPTFLYELLWNLTVAAVVVIVERRRPMRRGRTFALYIALYAAGRFVIEGIRIDPANSVGGLRTNEIVSLIAFAVATSYLVGTRKNPDDDRPVEQLPASDDATPSSGSPVSADTTNSESTEPLAHES